MSIAVATRSVADLIADLGGVPAERIRATPPPGTATIADAIAAIDRGEFVELVDGVLVEKAMGWEESVLGTVLGRWLGNFTEKHDLGEIAGADGFVELLSALVRGPDVAFYTWETVRSRTGSPKVPRLVPYFAIEVLSDFNTIGEMKRKRGEYFEAGVVEVWLVDPVKRTITAYQSTDQFVVYKDGRVPGPGVLADWSVSVAELFGRLDRGRPS